MNYFYRVFLFSFLFLPMLFAQDSTTVEVGPGVKYHAVTKPSGPWNIRILEIDLSNPSMKLRTELARDVLGTGLEKTSSMAARNNKSGSIVVGAINGDYFGISDPNNPYTFLSNSMIEEGEFTFGRTHSRSSFGSTADNVPIVNVLNFIGTVYAANDSIREINSVNRQRTTDQMVLYNQFIGPNTLTNTFGIEIRLEPIEPLQINNNVKFVASEKVSGVGSMIINEDYILSGHGTSNSWLNANVNVGDTVELFIGTSPEVNQLTSLIGGGPRLMTDGVKPPTFVGYEGFGDSHVNTQHPRTAVGYNDDSTKVFFLTVDGRQPGFSIGMSLDQLADYMISIGIKDAINLDGGGSTTMVVRNNVVNTPSDPGGERSVGNSLLAIAEVSVEEIIDTFSLAPEQILIDSTQIRKININGIDIWGYTIELAPADLVWEVIGINGIVDSLGFFIPAETGNGKIVGTINGISDTILVSVVEDIIPVWSFSAGGGNLPGWLSPDGSTERGFAYGNVNGNDRLYVGDRPNDIIVLDAATGDQIGTLSLSGVSGGTYPFNDVEVSDDGKIFTANLTLNPSSDPFKVYMWNDESSTAENIISFNGTSLRMGDKFTVVGSTADNSAVVYAVGASSNKVFKWTMSSGTFNPTPVEITLSGITNTGTSPSVYPRGIGNANIFVNGNSMRPKEYSQTGQLIDELPTSVVESRSNSMRYIESGDEKYLIVYQYGFPNENAQVLDITNGLTNAAVLETTPSLGTNANNIGTSGDVDFREYQQGVYIFYLLATNNGIAAYQLVNENQVPVELTSFSANLNGSIVNLKWQTASETNNQGFEIERKFAGKNSTNWSIAGSLNGQGTTTEPFNYSWSEDISIFSTEKIIYRLKQIDFDGTFSYSNEAEVELLPLSYSLDQNFPNPFNPTTTINFSIPNEEIVTLKVYDILGKEVALLLNEKLEAGNHEVDFNASYLASGMYIYKLQAGSFSSTKKLMLLK